MNHTVSAFIALARSSKFTLFLIKQLPAAYFSGVRIKKITEEACSVAVPYKWFTKNPFGSTYFACLAMAAELSTGALAMANVYKRKPAVSMLVIKTEASYLKKATGITTFTCKDGAAFTKTVADAVVNGLPQTLSAVSEGINEEGALIAKFIITWSFKVKS